MICSKEDSCQKLNWEINALQTQYAALGVEIAGINDALQIPRLKELTQMTIENREKAKQLSIRKNSITPCPNCPLK